MYLYLPYHLKLGTLKWNQSEIAFDNNSTISTEAFSPTAGLGKTINFLILDEFAWCPANDVELFYNNILPTVTADTNSNICIMSTQKGFNLFYKLWHAAETGYKKAGGWRYLGKKSNQSIGNHYYGGQYLPSVCAILFDIC